MSRLDKHMSAVLGRLRFKMQFLPSLLNCDRTLLGSDPDIRIEQSGQVHFNGAVSIGRRFTLRLLGNMTIGDDVFMNNDVHVVCHSTVIIGDRVRLGERVSIHDENHVFEPMRVARTDRDSYNSEPIIIREDVWIGCNSILLSGVEVGAGTVVAAGSVVTRSLPPGVLAAGSPASVIRKLKE